MFKLIWLSILLCTLLLRVNAEENATITKEIKLSKPLSTTIIDGSQLLTLSSNRTHIFVNSTDEPSKPCILAVNREEHSIQKNVKATILGDKIVVWGVRTKYVINRRTRMDYTVIIVDPKQCTYKPVATYEEETLGFDVNKNLPIVVAHGDNFDLFYSTVKGCSPCRYSIDGNRLDLKQSIDVEPLESSISTHVKNFDKDGFLYAHNYENQTSVVKIYDRSFNVIKHNTLNHTVDFVEISSVSFFLCVCESVYSYEVIN